MQTEELSSLLYRILTLDQQAARIKHTLPEAAIKQYYEKSLMEEGLQSLNMETIYSTRKEIADTYKARPLGMITK